jgi:hypothetical protein
MVSDWDQLSGDVQGQWTTLGWSEESWQGTAPAPPSSALSWGGLSAGQQAAAAELGYSPPSWDASPDDSAPQNAPGQGDDDDNLFARPWADITADVHTALAVFGFNEGNWGAHAPPQLRTKWAELTDAERDAATTIGFDQSGWDRNAAQMSGQSTDPATALGQKVYQEGYDEGFGQGYAATYAEEYDQAVADKDLPLTAEETLDEKWPECATLIKENYAAELENWFWGKQSTFECIEEGD